MKVFMKKMQAYVAFTVNNEQRVYLTKGPNSTFVPTLDLSKAAFWFDIGELRDYI